MLISVNQEYYCCENAMSIARITSMMTCSLTSFTGINHTCMEEIPPRSFYLSIISYYQVVEIYPKIKICEGKATGFSVGNI